VPGIVKGFVLKEFRGAPVKEDTLYNGYFKMTRKI
jgi:hypothetical protein